MKLTSQKIFITGGAGFIGSHLSQQLAKNNSVTIFDNFDSAVIPFSQNTNPTMIQGDIRNLDQIDKAMRGHTIVIAMAVAHVRQSLGNPLFVHDVNATGTLNTLLSAKKNHVKRFVYISSSEVYGTATENRMSEAHTIHPTTVYGVSKYVGELYTKQFHHQEELPSIIIRPFNTYGPRSHFDGYYGEVIPRMVVRALNNLPPLIFGDGSQSRDFTFVTDTVTGIIHSIESDILLGDVVNIAYGKEVTVQQIAHIICQEINPTLAPIYLPPRPNDVQRHAANTAKAKKVIHWKPSVDIKTGITQYIHWIKKTYPDVVSLLQKIPEKNWEDRNITNGKA